MCFSLVQSGCRCLAIISGKRSHVRNPSAVSLSVPPETRPMSFDFKARFKYQEQSNTATLN